MNWFIYFILFLSNKSIYNRVFTISYYAILKAIQQEYPNQKRSIRKDTHKSGYYDI